MKHKPPSEPELEQVLKSAEGLPARGWRRETGAGLDLFAARDPQSEEIVHLYARPERGDAVVRALDLARTEVPRLVAEVRSLRDELEAARSRPPAPGPAAALAGPAPVPASAPAPAARDVEIDAELGLGLAAPFRVSPKEVSAAKTDPLVALSIQVARALQPDARDVERARLIAMAHAAARGDLDAFWTARKMRTVSPAGAAAKGTARKK